MFGLSHQCCSLNNRGASTCHYIAKLVTRSITQKVSDQLTEVTAIDKLVRVAARPEQQYVTDHVYFDLLCASADIDISLVLTECCL